MEKVSTDFDQVFVPTPPPKIKCSINFKQEVASKLRLSSPPSNMHDQKLVKLENLSKNRIINYNLLTPFLPHMYDNSQTSKCHKQKYNLMKQTSKKQMIRFFDNGMSNLTIQSQTILSSDKYSIFNNFDIINFFYCSHFNVI